MKPHETNEVHGPKSARGVRMEHRTSLAACCTKRRRAWLRCSESDSRCGCQAMPVWKKKPHLLLKSAEFFSRCMSFERLIDASHCISELQTTRHLDIHGGHSRTGNSLNPHLRVRSGGGGSLGRFVPKTAKPGFLVLQSCHVRFPNSIF